MAPVDAPAPPVDAPAPVDAPPADGDHDGVADAADNCPAVANADQRDHDGDGRGDVCDGCPHVAETAPADRDGDGVGDACDPRPDDGGDRIALFDGFYDDADGPPSGWTATVGAGPDWRVRGGRLEQISTARGVHLLAWSGADLGDHAIDTRIEVTALAESSTADPIRTIGPVAGYRGAAGGPLWMCALRRDLRAGDTTLRLIELDATGAVASNDASPALSTALDAGTSATVRLRVARIAGDDPPLGVDERCESPAGAADAVTVTAADDLAVPGGAVGLRGNGVAARFDYVVVYALGGK